MKVFVFAIVFVILSATAFAGIESLVYQESLDLTINISSSISLQETGENPMIDYVHANLLLYPRQSQNIIAKNYISPKATENNGSLLFEWKSPAEKQLDFLIVSSIHSTQNSPLINSKVAFPVGKLSDDIFQYTLPSDNINSDDPNIIKKANELAAGEDDLFIVTTKIAQWVNENVNYSLNSQTVAVSQSASWTLEHKEGVCDEITSLFIGMVRSVGIPARFVSGMAYTNSDLFENPWGQHGWAEVYFPGYGWVPFDATYDQLGFVDSSHIPLEYSYDSNHSSITYDWRSHSVDIEPTPLRYVTTLQKVGAKVAPTLGLDMLAFRQSVKPGSYQLIEVNVTNLLNSYQNTKISIVMPSQLKPLENETKELILLPKEQKQIYWIIAVPLDLNKDSIYTFPVMVYSPQNISARTSFSSSIDDDLVTYDAVQEMIGGNNPSPDKKYEKSFTLNCSAIKSSIYEKETASILCTVKNSGNSNLDRVSVCLKTVCKGFDLAINRKYDVEFETDQLVVGVQKITLTAESGTIKNTQTIMLDVLDVPSLSIDGLSALTPLDIEDQGEINFSIKKISASKAYNVSISIGINNMHKDWGFSELSTSKPFEIIYKADTLKDGQNIAIINVDYFDLQGKHYTDQKQTKIELTKPGFFKRIVLFFKRLFAKG